MDLCFRRIRLLRHELDISGNSMNFWLAPSFPGGFNSRHRLTNTTLSMLALPALRIIPGVNGVGKSGADLARLVLDPQLEGVTGQYFVGHKSVPSSKDSYDERKAAELWESSVSMVHLKQDETILHVVTKDLLDPTRHGAATGESGSSR